MNESELRNAFIQRKPCLDSWGQYVLNEITLRLEQQGIDVSLFLKIPATHRVKDTDSFIDKALYRKRNYENPLIDITDQVGARFVVLLYQDVKLLRNIIENNDNWLYSLERDYELEGLAAPYLFDYQSVHYLVWTEEPIKYNSLEISGIKCEIQVRTLLQHAYAELTHDLIYKPEAMIPPEVKRIVGRSMALIETTDNLFEETAEVVKREVEHMRDINNTLLEICSKLQLPIESSKHLNSAIFYSIVTLLQDTTINHFVESICSDNSPIPVAANYLMNHREELIFKQPILPLILYLTQTKSASLYEKWDFDQKYLEVIYAQMGVTLPY